MKGDLRLSAFIGSLIAVSGVLAVAAWNLPAVPSQVHIGLAVLAASFVVAEHLVVYIEYRGESVGASAFEIPLVLGLAAAEPRAVLVATLGVVAIDVVRTRSAIKSLFAVGNRVLNTAAAVMIFHVICAGSSANSPLGWVAAVLAVTASTVLAGSTVWTVISLVNGRREPWRASVLPGVFVAVGNAVLGLLALQVLWVDWRGLWMIAAAAGGLWLGYRSYLKLRQRYGTLDLLHTFSHGVAGVTETDDVTLTSLNMARELLRGAEAQLVFRFPDGVVIKRIDDHGVLQSQAFRSGFLPAQIELFGFDTPVVIGQGEPNPELRAIAEHLGWDDLAFAPLGADGLEGLLVVANRLADVSTFDVEDLRVLETFAQNTGVALKVGELVDELRREVAEKEFQAMHDPLTGLPNRERIHHVLHDMLPGASENGLVAVALMDLDDFKDVNDTLGHTTGDALLEEIGRRLSAAVGARGTVARLGGDEFAVALCCMHSVDEAIAYIEQLKTEVEAPYVVDRLTLAVRFSIGIATAPTHGTEARTLLQRADIAMYAAKKSRLGVRLYAEELDTSSTRRLSLAGELAPALANGEFQLFYQPQLDLTTGRVSALEALARWPHAVHKSVPPDEFIPLVEQSGLIADFTNWAIDTALRDLALWREEFPDLRVSVNISARNLRGDFAGSVQQLLVGHRLPASALALELTESEVMSDPDRALDVLTQLHHMGIRIAIDDFGTGYSSLSYLKKLPVSEVKIDRSFVMNMLGSKEDIAIVESTIDLARSLGMETVAEGVETLEILERLAAVGCWAAQGYHVARPLPSAEIAGKIRSVDAHYGAARVVVLSSDPGVHHAVRFRESAA